MRKELSQLAKEHEDSIRYRDAYLQKEQEELTKRLNDIQRERKHLEKSLVRTASYDPNSVSCPRCFIDNAITAELIPVPSDNEFDKFKCSHCGTLLESES